MFPEAKRLKKMILTLLLACLLTGCAGTVRDGKSQFALLRARMLEQKTYTLKARVCADYGERVYAWLLTYAGDADSGIITVLEPAELENVAVKLDETGVTLYYDGAMLDTGAAAGLSPIQAFPMLIESWLTGCVTDCWQERRGERECIAARMDLTAAGQEELIWFTTWFDSETGQPLYSEIAENGTCVITADFSESV